MSIERALITASGPKGGAVYVDDVFSAYPYNGTASSQTITNGINLSDKGGMVWLKSRTNATNHYILDTVRGATKYLVTNDDRAEATQAAMLTSFGSSGFSLGSYIETNGSDQKFMSWTFRKQAKFFDIVTYTGNETARTISHNLGSTPGMIIVKSQDQIGNWYVYHKDLTSADYYCVLNQIPSPPEQMDSDIWNGTAPTSSVFSLGTSISANESGTSYVAYLFASDAGGFGSDGSSSIISCGTYTGTGSDVFVNIGWEPQFLITKKISGYGEWPVFDTTRKFSVSYSDGFYLNATDSETNNPIQYPTTNGFVDTSLDTGTFIYMAVKRSSTEVPIDATKVFKPVTYTGTGAPQFLDFGFMVDAWLLIERGNLDELQSYAWPLFSRLLSVNNAYSTAWEDPWGGGWGDNYLTIDNKTGVQLTDSPYYLNLTDETFVSYGFVRAPKFFDIVYYKGTGSARTVSHALSIAPELILVKQYDGSYRDWRVYSGDATKYLVLNGDDAIATSSSVWNDTAPTSSVFTVGTANEVNNSSYSYTAHLFATCPGVSKVGSYTGTGTTKQIDCGFTSGARFVLIKRTDDVGDWYVFDTARGIISGNDPYSRLNIRTGGETTGTDYIDPYSAGFEISSTSPDGINANGGSYIFLAIA